MNPTRYFAAFFSAQAPQRHCLCCLSRFYEVDTVTTGQCLRDLGDRVETNHDTCRNCGAKAETFVARSTRVALG